MISCLSFCVISALIAFSCIPVNAIDRYYYLEIDTIHVDGLPRNLTVINGTSPGPIIRATENDILHIQVLNKIFNDSTTIHWHGLYQKFTVFNDGVPGVTQCTIPTNELLTYTFKAEPAGTHFYHGHFNDQMVDGLFGGIIIDPLPSEPAPGGQTLQPSTQSTLVTYDKDVTLIIADWINLPALTVLDWYLSPASGGNEPTPDAIIVNGHFGSIEPFLTFNFQPTDRVRFRIINAAAFSMWNFTIDSLPITVFEIDGVLVEPLSLSYVVLNSAQRVSIIVDFSLLKNTILKEESSIYFRVHSMLDMYPIDPTNTLPPYEPNPYPYAPPVYFTPDFLGVFTFTNETSSTPVYAAEDETFQIVNQTIFPLSPLIDHQETNLMIAKPISSPRNLAPNATHQLYMEVEFFEDDEGVNRGHFNNIAHIRENEEPQLYKIMHQDNVKYSLVKPIGNIIQGNPISQYYIPLNAVVDMLINNTDDGEHPFHLHGQEFYVLATSEFPEAEGLYRSNYVRRDVVSVPESGWAKIRFIADNPGVWAFHCHIEWHMTSGLFSTMVTSPESLVNNPSYVIPSDHKDNCAKQYPDSNNAIFQPTSVASIIGYTLAALILVAVLACLVYRSTRSFRGSRQTRSLTDSYRALALDQNHATSA